MNIEKLIIIYIPAVFIKFFLISIFPLLVNVETYESNQNMQLCFSYVSVIASLVSHIDNIACAVWLAISARWFGRPAFLWFLFGLVAGLFSIVLYLLFYMGLEISNPQANHSQRKESKSNQRRTDKSYAKDE